MTFRHVCELYKKFNLNKNLSVVEAIQLRIKN